MTDEIKKIISTQNLESDHGSYDFKIITEFDYSEEDWKYAWTRLVFSNQQTDAEYRLAMLSDLKRIRDTLNKHIELLEGNEVCRQSVFGINEEYSYLTSIIDIEK